MPILSIVKRVFEEIVKLKQSIFQQYLNWELFLFHYFFYEYILILISMDRGKDRYGKSLMPKDRVDSGDPGREEQEGKLVWDRSCPTLSGLHWVMPLSIFVCFSWERRWLWKVQFLLFLIFLWLRSTSFRFPLRLSWWYAEYILLTAGRWWWSFGAGTEQILKFFFPCFACRLYFIEFLLYFPGIVEITFFNGIWVSFITRLYDFILFLFVAIFIFSWFLSWFRLFFFVLGQLAIPLVLIVEVDELFFELFSLRFKLLVVIAVGICCFLLVFDGN